MTISEAQEQRVNWYNTATEEEKCLGAKCGEYEQTYFEDFLLEPNSILHDFVCYQVEVEPGKCFETSYDFPDIELWQNGYIFKIDNLDDLAGQCDGKHRIITIDPEYANNPATILHEMIHAYINLFNETFFFRMEEYLLLSLYNDLKMKIPDLDKIIIDHSHMIRQEDFDNHGWHGILFFLKSLDLDLRLDLPLGTVCGYGRNEYCSAGI
jgi:hypothetical protein